MTDELDFILVPSPGSSAPARGQLRHLKPRPPGGGGTGPLRAYTPRPPDGGGVGTTIDLSGISEYVGRLAPDEPIMIEVPKLYEAQVPAALDVAKQYGRHVFLIGPSDIA